MKKSVKSDLLRLSLILGITCASLVGCSANQAPPCLATQPTLKNVTETDSGFIVTHDDMAQITVYIEQLRQCVGIER